MLHLISVHFKYNYLAFPIVKFTVHLGDKRCVRRSLVCLQEGSSVWVVDNIYVRRIQYSFRSRFPPLAMQAIHIDVHKLEPMRCEPSDQNIRVSKALPRFNMVCSSSRTNMLTYACIKYKPGMCDTRLLVNEGVATFVGLQGVTQSVGVGVQISNQVVQYGSRLRGITRAVIWTKHI